MPTSRQHSHLVHRLYKWNLGGKKNRFKHVSPNNMIPDSIWNFCLASHAHKQKLLQVVPSPYARLPLLLDPSWTCPSRHSTPAVKDVLDHLFHSCYWMYTVVGCSELQWVPVPQALVQPLLAFAASLEWKIQILTSSWLAAETPQSTSGERLSEVKPQTIHSRLFIESSLFRSPKLDKFLFLTTCKIYSAR